MDKLTLPWFPVWIVEAQTDAIDIAAPDDTTANALAQLWSVNSGTPCLEYPYTGIRPPGYKYPLDANGNPIFDAPYPMSTKPYVSMKDRRTIGHVWWTTAYLPPNRSSAFTTPTQAQWQAAITPASSVITTSSVMASLAIQDISTPVSLSSLHVGQPTQSDIHIVNLDNPNWNPNWNIYHRYIINHRCYVWYYQAATKDAAQALAQADWLTNGVYALNRNLTDAEAADYNTGVETNNWVAWNNRGISLPSKQWNALFSMVCEPAVNERNPMPGSFEYISDAPYGKRPPYDNRSLIGYPVVQAIPSTAVTAS